MTGMNYFDSNRTNMVILKFEEVKVMDSEIVVETVA
jgi:hypothetical protein